MRIDIAQLGIMLVYIVASWFTAFFDTMMMQFGLSFLTLFPFVLLGIYFFTRYNTNRWIFISIFIFLYLLISIIPIWIGLVILLSFISAEKILGSVLNRFNVIQVLVMIIFITLLMSLVYEYQLNFLSWLFVPVDWSVTNIHEHLIRVLLGFVFGFVMYPFFSMYEARHKLYLSSH